MLMRACRVRQGRRGNAPGRSWMLSLQRLLQRGTRACRRRQARLTVKVRLGCLSPGIFLHTLLETYIFSFADRAGADARIKNVEPGAPAQVLREGQQTLKLWDGQDP